MSLLSPKLQLRVAQKQILTPGLVQMVTVLQLNRLELKEMLTQEMVKNPVLEESGEEGDEVTPRNYCRCSSPSAWPTRRTAKSWTPPFSMRPAPSMDLWPMSPSTAAYSPMRRNLPHRR